MLRLAQGRESLRTSLWFVPSICVLVAAIAAEVLVRVSFADGDASGSPLVFGGGAESARTLLSTLAASMITFIGLTFSITMVVLQLTGSQYSPRVLRTFLRDRQSQWTLGIFVATFVYVVLVLREIRGGDGVTGATVIPGLAINVAFAFVLLSLGMFVAYINHMAQAIRPESIIGAVATETRSLIVHRELLGPSISDDTTGPAAPPPSRTTPEASDASRDGMGAVQHVSAAHAGVIQSIDADRLVGMCVETNTRIEFTATVGDFVPRGAPLFELVHSDRLDEDRQASIDRMMACVAIGASRSMQQDIAFGIRQLVDIAVRALSPGVNDPTTAVQALDQLHDLLRQLVTRAMPARNRQDGDGIDRVILRVAQWDDYVHLAFDEIRQYGADSTQVLRRLLAALEDLLDAAPPTRRRPLEQQMELVNAAADRAFPDEADRARARLADRQGLGSS